MNYLLVMPKSLGSIEHFNIFPIGLAYVSASMKKGGFNVFTTNLDYVEGDTYTIFPRSGSAFRADHRCGGQPAIEAAAPTRSIRTPQDIQPVSARI
jgi:hypothetical protein